MSDDFDMETATGVPDRMPSGERIMWQGAPHWRSLVRHAFHADKIALYFAAWIAVRWVFGWHDGADLAALISGSLTLVAACALALLIVGLLAWQSARTTTYTLTTRRLFIRSGMAIPMTLTIPLSRIVGAHVAMRGDGTGDIALAPEATSRLAYLMLWPHARPWHVLNPEPALRSVADAKQVAQLVGEALQATEPQMKGSIVRVRPVALPVTQATSGNSQQLAAGLFAAE